MTPGPHEALRSSLKPVPAHPALDVKNLVCSYNVGNAMLASGIRRCVVDGVSFSIAEGECLGLLGDSGGGKSTIARCVAGLMEPESGSISILGMDVFPRVNIWKRLRGKVQMLYQDHAASLDPMLTVRESLSEAVRAHQGPRLSETALTLRLEESIEQVGLRREALGQFPKSLSGGERQRIALARSLAVDPVLLVLDEPTSALDISTQTQILDLIVSLQKKNGMAVLFISHDVDAAARICSHIALLDGGRIVEHDTTDTVLSHPVHPYTRRIMELHRQPSRNPTSASQTFPQV